MNYAKSKKLSIILSIFWLVGGIISSFALQGTSSFVFLATLLVFLVFYWVVVLKFGSDSFQTFFESSKFYAPILEITNLILQIKNFNKEKKLSQTTMKYRLLFILATILLIVSYLLSGEIEFAEKLGTILVYSPFIFLAFNGKKTAYIVFFMLISLDSLAAIFSGGIIIHNLMKWLLLSIVSLNAYTIENIKK